MAETILAKMAVQIAANTAEFNKALTKSQKDFSAFTSSVTKLAGTIGVAFGVREVAAFGLEVAKLAGEAEGVRAAFERLPNSVALMEQLKDATAGTVSELDLMKRSVQAANFGIALESLPQLLEFAAIRAQQTGQSVDYLVDSIITGIGRKSPLILDNLGISAVRLKEQFGGAALEAQNIGDVAKAVGRIATEELEKMGDFSENTSTKIQRISASWEDLKVAIGNAANNSGVIQRSLDIFTNFFNALAGDELTTGINQLSANLGTGSEILERFAAAGGKIDLSWQELLAKGFVRNEEAAKKLEERLAAIAKKSKDLAIAAQAVGDQIDPSTGLPIGGGKPFKPEVVQKEITTIDALREKVKQLNEQFAATDITDQKKLQNIGSLIVATNQQIEALERLRKKQEEVNKSQLSAFGRQQLSDAETRSKGETPLTAAPLEFKFGPEDTRDLTNIFPTELPAPDVDLFMNNIQMATAAIKELGVTGVQSYDQMRLAGDLQAEAQARQTMAAMQFGEAIGQALGSAIDGQKTFAQALKGLTKQILGLFLQQALGAAIAGAFKSAKNPIVGAVLAGVATGVVSAMFSKIGGPSKSVSASVSQPSERNSNFRQSLPNEQVILVGGEIRMKNNQLVVALENARKEKQRTG